MVAFGFGRGVNRVTLQSLVSAGLGWITWEDEMTKIVAKAAIKDLTVGDRVQLLDPDGVGEIISIAHAPIIEGSNGLVVEIEWRRKDTGKRGHYLGTGEDTIGLA